MTAKFCICGEPVGLCLDCYPNNFTYNTEKDEYNYTGPKIKNIDKNQIPLEKLNPISDSVLLSKFTELTKLFYSTMKSCDWSQGLKEEKKKAYRNIENEIKEQLNIKENENKKKCDDSGCKCDDCPNIKKRWTAKKMFLTIDYNEAPKAEIMEYFKNSFNLCKIAVAQEEHKEVKHNTNKHLHLYIEWTAKKDIKNKDYLNLPENFSKYGNIITNIKTIKKQTKENVYSYMLKTDKNCISWGFNIHMDVYGKLKTKELWYKYYTGEWSMKDIIAYDPSIAFGRNLEKIKERIDSNFLWADRDSGSKASQKINWS